MSIFLSPKHPTGKYNIQQDQCQGDQVIEKIVILKERSDKES